MAIERRELRHDDVAVRVDHCGVCHTDLHALRAHTGEGPLVPGHEFTGAVTAIGGDVTRFAVGDPVAVGNIVDSCGRCAMCRAGQENFCHAFPTLTYGGTDRHDGSRTLGAYSREYVVRDRFVYPLPSGLDPAAAAPLLCAGITVWEPMWELGVGPGTRVAVAGLGGLGHLAVKFAVALGAETSVLSRSADKADDARALGAHDLVVSTDDAQTAAARDRFDVVIDTVAVSHDVGPTCGSSRWTGRCATSAIWARSPSTPWTCWSDARSWARPAAAGRWQRLRCSSSAPGTASPPTSRSSRPPG